MAKKAAQVKARHVRTPKVGDAVQACYHASPGLVHGWAIVRKVHEKDKGEKHPSLDLGFPSLQGRSPCELERVPWKEEPELVPARISHSWTTVLDEMPAQVAEPKESAEKPEPRPAMRGSAARDEAIG
jgi:hypothetical protein